MLSFDFGEFGARSRKCIAVVLRRPQHERPSRYGGSGRGHSTVSGTRGRGASDLRLHLKQSVLIWCFPSISVTTSAQSGRCVAEARSQPQHEQPSRYGGSKHSQSPAACTRGGGASDLRLYLKQSLLVWCFRSISAAAATQRGKCVEEALSQPQHEQPSRYGVSGHRYSTVSGARGRGASDLRLHLKQSVLIWCFPSISVTTSAQSGRCVAEALSPPQHEQPTGYGGSKHSQSPAVRTRGGGASDLRLHLKQRVLQQ